MQTKMLQKMYLTSFRKLSQILALCWTVLAPPALAAEFNILTPHPQASKAGMEILKNGGSASDAALTAYSVLSLVMPHKASLAGGGFALHYDKASGNLEVFDVLETAPDQVGKYLFTGPDGKPLKKQEANVGGRSVGVPGFPALLAILHHKFGKIRWNDLFAAGLMLAEHGLEVSQDLADAIAANHYSPGKYTQGRQ